MVAKNEENQLIRNLLSYHEPMHTREARVDKSEASGVERVCVPTQATVINVLIFRKFSTALRFSSRQDF